MISMPSPYQVIVDYYHKAPVYGPMENAENAHHRYGIECGRLYEHDIRKVVLCKHGIVVAQATHDHWPETPV